MRKLNNADNYESINLVITKEKYPIIFENKVSELIEECGVDRYEAEHEVEGTEIELELYYENGAGLFGVESEAVEQGAPIYSPYTKEEYEPYEE